MKYLLTILTTFITATSFCQSRKTEGFKTFEFVTLDQRIICVNQPYIGKISALDSNTFKYGNKILFVNNIDFPLKEIFKKGIIYPDIFNIPEVNNTDSSKTNNKTDSSVIIVKVNIPLSSFFGGDSLTISDLREINFSKEVPSIKEFEFLLWRKHLLNPTEYRIRLLNDNATHETDMRTFIRGARLIYMFKGSILI